MHENEYHSATVEELEYHILTLMQRRNNAGVKTFLVGVAERKDYLVIESLLSKTLLMNDFVEMHRQSFEERCLSEWCSTNVNHVIQHCPDTLAFWATAPTNRPGAVVEQVARALSKMSTIECLRLLRGQFQEPFDGYLNMFGQKMLYEQLNKNAWNWGALSPYWIRTPELRTAASQLGWTPQYLPKMVQRNIWSAGSKSWLASVSYPYTLMACEIVRHAQTLSAAEPGHKEIITCFSAASAIDIAMAKRILSAAAPDSGVALRRPRAVQALDEETERRIDGFVQAHVLMNTLDTLAQELAHGAEVRLEMDAAVELPDMFNMQ